MQLKQLNKTLNRREEITMRPLFRFKCLKIIAMATVLLFTLTAEARAVMQELTFDQLCAESDSIVVGKVKDISSRWNIEGTYIYTTVSIAVLEDIKGTGAGEKISVIVPGGKSGEISQYVSGTPAFEQGEVAILFLSEADQAAPGLLHNRAGVYEVAGRARGKIAAPGYYTDDIKLKDLEEELESGNGKSTLAGTGNFVYNGFKWPGPSPQVPYRVNASSSKNKHLRSAAETWNNAGADFAFSYAGEHSRNGSYAYNGINEIMWHDLGVNYVLAVAVVWRSGDKILESDMIFNSRYKWSTELLTPLGYHDVKTVALHEFGHWLSLCHSPVFDSVMYHAYKGAQHYLHPVDVEGIKYIYGSSEVPDNHFKINVAASPEIGGTVSGEGIYEAGEEVLITAAANEHFLFTNWTNETEVISDNPTHFITAEASKTVTANFRMAENVRIAGSNRYETAVQVSETGWPEGAAAVVLASGLNFPDALAGVPLAHHLGAPVLLNPRESIHTATRKELERLNPEQVIILGGTAAISGNVEEELSNMGLAVERIGGSNRFETAALIADRLSELVDFESVFIAGGSNFPDALAAASYAAFQGVPVLLSGSDSLPESTALAIESLGIESTVVAGGPGAIKDSVLFSLPNPARIYGADRYQTALQLAAEYLPGDADKIYFATGLDFPDALAGSVLAAGKKSGILLLNGTGKGLLDEIACFIRSSNIREFSIFGGAGAVSIELELELKNILSE